MQAGPPFDDTLAMLEPEPTLITFKIDSAIELGLKGLGGDATLNEP